MHSSYLCELYIHIISILFVCSQEFTHQRHQNPYNRRIIRPNSEHNHKQQFPQQNAMFAGRAHPRPNTMGFEDTTQRPQESTLPQSESTSHARQQMPYESNDPHLRSTSGRQQLMSHLSHRRQDSNEMPFHLPPKYVQNSNSYQNRRSIYPEINEDSRHLRIQSPLERDFDNNVQNGAMGNNFRRTRKKTRDNFDFDDGNINEDPRQQFAPFSHGQPSENRHRQNFFPSQDPEQINMRMVTPKAKTRLEGVRGKFESFSTKHDHQEFDKIFPEPPKYNTRPFNEMKTNDENEDYPNLPENEAQYQRNLNLYPPVEAQEEIRRFNEPFESPPPRQRQNRRQMPDYLQTHIRNTDPNNFYSSDLQNQNKANHQNFEGFQQSIRHSPPFHSMSGTPNGQSYYGDNNLNGFDFRRNNVNKPKNRFQPFYGNDFQRETTQKPHKMHNTYGKPVTKEIQIVREITEILPSDQEQSNDDHFDPSPIATPSPPDPPHDYFPFDSPEEKEQKSAENEEKPKEKSIDLGKEENFYDDEEERLLLQQKNKYSDDIDDEEDKKETKTKSKFEKEVDLSADDLENYFDKEFANENEEEREAQKKIGFDDEPKESNQMVTKKDKSDEPEEVDIEAEYKSATDFLKNHDDFLNKIEKENEKFRKRTEDKVEKEEEPEEADTGTEKPNVDEEVEKELDRESDKQKDGEEQTEDKEKTEQKTNADDKGVTEEEEATDTNEETKDKKETEAEDDEESETKEVTEKEEQKNADNNEDNKQNEEKNEEQEDDNGVKDEEKTDNTEIDETNESEEEKETKSDKCLESNCDKELLKEESKESTNRQELKSKEETQVVEQKTQQNSGSVSSIQTKPMEEKPNRSLRISERHNFAPFFIDLKRINPNKSNTGNGSQNNERQTSRTTSATTGSSPKQSNSSNQSVSPHTESRDANKVKPVDNNNTIETRRVVNSIKDIIKSQNHR